MLYNQVSFPGFGIGPVKLDPDAFSIGSFSIKWYAIFIVTGILFAAWYVYTQGKKKGLLLDDLLDCALYIIFPAIICARLYYVIFKKLENPELYTTFASWFDIRSGGLAIYGGIIGGCLGIFLACKVKKLNWRRVFDMIAPGVMVAQAIGRWGNFFNGEAYGYAIGDTTRFYFLSAESTLASGEGTFFHTMRMGLSSFFGTVYYHPTFFYECVWNLLGFALINLFYKHKKYHGQVALMYFTWYGFGRMFIEGFRTDSLYIPGTTLRISQCLGLVCFLVGTVFLILFATVPRLREWVEREKTVPVAVAAATADAPAAEAAEVPTEAVNEEPRETTESKEEPTQENMEEQEDGNAD